VSDATDTLQEMDAGLAEPLAGPPEHAILVLEIMWAFHDMLDHEQGRHIVAAEVARRRCVDHAAKLRAVYDPDPDLGPDKADVTIAWAIHNARYLFARGVHPDEWQRHQTYGATAFAAAVAV
jgi:hypothetical protein